MFSDFESVAQSAEHCTPSRRRGGVGSIPAAFDLIFSYLSINSNDDNHHHNNGDGFSFWHIEQYFAFDKCTCKLSYYFQKIHIHDDTHKAAAKIAHSALKFSIAVLR